VSVCLSVCVCLCLPVCHNSEFYRNVGRIELVSGMGASFHPSYTVLKNRVSPKIRALASATLSRTPDLQNFASVYRSSKRVIDLARERWTHTQCDKLDRRLSTKLIMPSSSDARPLVYHSNRQALSTAQFRRAGQLATADTCQRRSDSEANSACSRRSLGEGQNE